MLIWEADTKFYIVGFFHCIKHEKSKYFIRELLIAAWLDMNYTSLS